MRFFYSFALAVVVAATLRASGLAVSTMNDPDMTLVQDTVSTETGRLYVNNERRLRGAVKEDATNDEERMMNLGSLSEVFGLSTRTTKTMRQAHERLRERADETMRERADELMRGFRPWNHHPSSVDFLDRKFIDLAFKITKIPIEEQSAKEKKITMALKEVKDEHDAAMRESKQRYAEQKAFFDWEEEKINSKYYRPVESEADESVAEKLREAEKKELEAMEAEAKTKSQQLKKMDSEAERRYKEGLARVEAMMAEAEAEAEEQKRIMVKKVHPPPAEHSA